VAFGFAIRRCFSAAANVSMRCRSISALSIPSDEFFFAAADFGVLNFDLSFFFDLLHSHAFGDDLLLHDIGLNVVDLVGLRLLLFGDFEYCAFLTSSHAAIPLLGLGEVSASTRSWSACAFATAASRSRWRA